MDTLLDDFHEAVSFTTDTHKTDIDWFYDHTTRMTDFDSFYKEYIYVVLASGFRSQIASRLVEPLFECKGNIENMLVLFKNKRKCDAISEFYRNYSNNPTLFSDFVESLHVPEDLKVLPFIGNITMYHLARNVGLSNDVVKPDVHLERYTREVFTGEEEKTPLDLCRYIQSNYKENELQLGMIDFILWVWLSHDKGQRKKSCCYGKSRLR